MTALLQSKLTIPAARPVLVDRSDLLRRLEMIRYHRLLLVSAPAGFGKTTLVSEWVNRLTIGDLRNTKYEVRVSDALTGKRSIVNQKSTIKNRVAWLSLGEEDNDPARFLTYLKAALAKAGLIAPPKAASNTAPNDVMTDIVNEVTAALTSQPDAHVFLILDDYHLIHNRVIHKTIVFLLEHMPAQMHLILVTRADPPLPLARWRARGQLVEIRQQELRFSTEEAEDFFKQVMQRPLSAADVETLNRRTEGWIAGLQMAAVSLQGQTNVREFVQTFGGSHRFILDYLMEEVLTRQSAEVTQFLLQTAVLDRLSASLCAAILWDQKPTAVPPQSAIHNAQEILNQLESANLFLVSLDDERRWFRYHRLFADLLRQRLSQTHPEQISILHERAAAWYEAQGYPEDAISHLLQGGITDKAARLIEQQAEAMLMRSELVTVMGWISALPEKELVQRPLLSLYYGWTLIMDGHAQEQVEAALQHVSTEGASGEISLVRSLSAILRGDGITAIEQAQQALTQLAPDRTFLRGFGSWVLGLAFLYRGELDRGVDTLEKAFQLSQQVGNMTVAVASLGRLANQAWREGDLLKARKIYEQSLVLATNEAERPLPIAGESHLGLARIYYEWNELETALQQAEVGLALAERYREQSTVTAHLWLARIQQVRHNETAASRASRRARQIALQTKGTQFDDMAVAIYEASLNLLKGDAKAVEAWCQTRQIPQTIDIEALEKVDDIIEGHLRKYELVILARLHLAQKRPAKALTLLETLLINAQRLQRFDLQIEIHLLSALAHRQQGALSQADHHMEEALKIGEKGPFIRLFVDAGDGVVDLLNRQRAAAAGENRRAYLSRLLAACGQTLPGIEQTPSPASPSLIEPLSERELEVLTLIAEGLSNRQIAQRLVLSLPTIKWHTSNIYGKLGVNNRTTAVARARELKILP
ncbi:MAG: LuxR C-terminal-related transcriptional regulator [Ardenticatenaceae bacterium]|nr:LuxR C-terminal-related transcriptional regulator [Ardenticatenaceae bacterium]